MRTNLLLILMIGFVAVGQPLAETIDYISSGHVESATISFKVYNEKNEIIPCTVTLLNEAKDPIWGLDANGKQLTYKGQPRIWISGDTIISITADTYECIISKPYLHKSHVQTITLEPGSETIINATLEQIVDLRQMGWVAGDAHQHVLHGEREFAVNPEIASQIAQSEGVDWSLFNSGYSSVADEHLSIEEAQRRFMATRTHQYYAMIGDEYPKDHLGHMAMFPGIMKNWYDQVGKNEYSPKAGETEDFAHFEIMRHVNLFGGLCIYTHPIREWGGTEDSPGNIARELPFDILAAPDLIETMDLMTDNPDDPQVMKLWYSFLNINHQIGICAFNDTCFDRGDAQPFKKRTYVYIGQSNPSQQRLSQAIRNGLTIASSGPLMLVTLEGRAPGSVLPADNEPKTLEIAAFAPGCDYTDRARQPLLDRVELIRNGEIIHTFDLREQNQVGFRSSLELNEAENAWYIIKAFTDVKDQVAISSPFYFRTPNFRKPAPIQAQVNVQFVDQQTGEPLQGTLDMIEYRKTNSKVVETIQVNDKAEFTCSPTLRLKANVPGYLSQTKSIFFDTPELYQDLIVPLKRSNMFDGDYYENIINVCQNIDFVFELERESEP